MKRLVGWLADFFPNTIFYSRRFIGDLRFEDSDKPHSTKGNTALLGVVVAASRSMEPGSTMTGEYTSVTDRGKNVGNYRITVERLPE